MSTYQKEVIDPGDAVSRIAHGVCVASYRNCPAVQVLDAGSGSFRGSVGFVWQDHILLQMIRGDREEPMMCEVLQNDGAGGKPQFFTMLGEKEVFYQLGWEVIVMNADDIARFGGFPAIMVNEVSFKRVTPANLHLAEAMLRGYSSALRRARLVNITGETAIMRHSIAAFSDTGSDSQLVLTWSGTCLGLNHQRFHLDGSKIGPSMAIVGFQENGYRCNGGTAFTKLLLAIYGSDVRAIARNPEARQFIRKLCVPSVGYAGTVTRLIGWNPDGSPGTPLADIRGIAHITGGGVWKKLADALPEGVGAKLDSMPDPPAVLFEAKKRSQRTSEPLSDHDCYGTFHGGCGMLVICPKDEVDSVLRAARADGIGACYVGYTFASDNREIIIESRFSEGRIVLSSLELPE